MIFQKKTLITFVVLLSIAILFVSFSPSLTGNVVKSDLKQIDFSISAIPHSVLVFIALENAYFQEEGLNVDIHHYSSGKLALDSLLLGKSDFATTADFPLTIAGLNNLETYIIGTVGYGDDVKVIAHNEIESLEELKGKTIATFKGTGADFFMQKLFAQEEISLDEIDVVNLAPPNMIPAFVSKDIDAFIIWEPHIYNANKQLSGNTNIFSPKGIYGETWNIAVNKDIINDQETITSFLSSLKRADEYYQNNFQKSVLIASKYSGADKDVVVEILTNFNIGLNAHDKLVDQMIESAHWLDERFDNEDVFNEMQRSDLLVSLS